MAEVHFEVIGLDNVFKTIDDMTDEIKNVGQREIFEELVAWQREDMNRKYPNALQDTEHSAVTGIWPRSRTWVPKGKGGKAPTRVYAPPRRSTRPILRAELLTMLQDRMVKMVSDLLKWQTKG